MAYRIEYDTEAEADLDTLTKREQVIVRTGAPKYLRDQPGLEAGAREKMRPNRLNAPWALHLGTLRVYYDVDEAERVVWVLRVGRKPGETLYLRGRPFDLG